jgi:hypothetical protein
MERGNNRWPQIPSETVVVVPRGANDWPFPASPQHQPELLKKELTT